MPGVVARDGDAAVLVASLVVVDGQVAQVFVVRNPEELHAHAHDRRSPDLGSGA